MAGTKGSMPQEQRNAASERMKKLNEKKRGEKAADAEKSEGGAALDVSKTTETKSPPTPDIPPSVEDQPITKTPSKSENDMSWLDDKVTITLHEMEGMPSHQYVGLNGVGYVIEVGKEVTVPRAILQVLNDAVIHTKEYTPVPGVSGAYNVNNKTIRRFAISSKA